MPYRRFLYWLKLQNFLPDHLASFVIWEWAVCSGNLRYDLYHFLGSQYFAVKRDEEPILIDG